MTESFKSELLLRKILSKTLRLTARMTQAALVLNDIYQGTRLFLKRVTELLLFIECFFPKVIHSTVFCGITEVLQPANKFPALESNHCVNQSSDKLL